MSLDITLISKDPQIKECEHCRIEYEDHEYLFDANITHNLTTMASKANIYDCLWNADQLKTAEEIIEPLKKGLTDMKERPYYYKQFDTSNGWGTYNQFIPWLENLLEACIDYPDATICISK